MPEAEQIPDVTALTVQLLSAYLANNSVASGELADLIRTTRVALTGEAEVATPEVAETFTPAVSARKSLASPAQIISLIDGKPYKTLKRHLASHGLTPDTYRSRYGLPASYPMVAPDYAAHRRAVAQKVGLGTRKPVVAASEPVEAAAEAEALASLPTQQPEAKAPAKKRGRGPAKKLADSDQSETAVVADAAPAVSADAPAKAKTAPKPKRASSKSPRGKAAKTRTESASSAAVAEPAAASNDAPTDKADAPKRRGRIGLFKADATQAPEQSDAQPDEGSVTATSDATPAKSSPKAKKRTPRMARETGKTAAAKDDAS